MEDVSRLFQIMKRNSYFLNLYSKISGVIKHSRKSTIEFFCENSVQLKAVNYFRKKAPS